MIGLLGFALAVLGRTIQVEDEAGGRERGAPATVDCFAAQAPWSRPAYKPAWRTTNFLCWSILLTFQMLMIEGRCWGAHD
jgi:hypothetical protein